METFNISKIFNLLILLNSKNFKTFEIKLSFKNFKSLNFKIQLQNFEKFPWKLLRTIFKVL